MKETKNSLINRIINIINNNNIVTYACLIEFFAYDCKLYEPDDLVENMNGTKGFETTSKHILNTDYDSLYDCAIIEKDFFVTYLTQRKETIAEIEEDNLKEDILDLIENHDLTTLSNLKEYIINSGNDTSDDNGDINLATAREYATKLLMYIEENAKFFKTYLLIKNN